MSPDTLELATIALKLAATRFSLAALNPEREAPFMALYAEDARKIIDALAAAMRPPCATYPEAP